jgi:aspartate carbamoyltransferase catalytic subunit
MMRLGMNVYTSGPEVFQEKDMNVIDFKEGLTKCDVIMMLRMQTERHAQNIYDMTDYNKRYGLNFDNIKLLKDKAIIMHPAPVSRNIEIIDELVESPRSRIFKQINNGVFIRMAVIKYLLG